MRFFTVALILVAAKAQAALTLSLAPADRPAAPNGVVTFTGTLTNTSATDKLFLNDIQASLTAGTTTLKSNAFFNNVPGILLPNETYIGPLFAIKLESGVTSGNYTGSVTINGGATIFANAELGNSALSLLATPVEQWRFNTFGDAATDPAAADFADFDHDRAPNLLEYALGLNGAVMDVNAMPKPVKIGGHLTLSYIPAATDVNYIVESSTDLITWITADVEPITVANPDPPGSITYWYKNSLAGTQRVFMRVRVTR